MTEEQQLKLQAFLDGELPESDSRKVAAWIAQDADAAALLGELTNTWKALKDIKPEIKLPESREFYWSKIKREIERAAPEPVAAPKGSLSTWFRRAFVPLGAMAALALVALVVVNSFSSGGHHPMPMSANVMLGSDASAFTYRDDAQDMTVVWLSYPAENKFAQKSSGDTLSPK
jgi:anti-sigma factor RsiW